MNSRQQNECSKIPDSINNSEILHIHNILNTVDPGTMWKLEAPIPYVVGHLCITLAF